MHYEGTTRDGTRIVFRHIRPDDKDGLRRGFEALSPESRYRRFFRHLDHLSDEQLRYLTEVDFKDHGAWLAVLPDEPGEPGVGVARWIRIRDEPDVAEGAVTVADHLHGRGIGSTLLWVAARSAIERGIRAIRVYVQGENHPMLRLLGDLGSPTPHWEDGVAQIDIPLPSDPDDLARTPATLVLRAVAAGELVGEAPPREEAGGLRFPAVPREEAGGGAPDRT